MQVLALTRQHFGNNLELLAQMFRLRRRVFKERLDWSVSVSGDLEMDIYDTFGPTYLVLLNDRSDVVGCVRFLAMTGPTMVARTFSSLVDRHDIFEDTSLIESSRFCVDTQSVQETADNQIRRATFVLFAGMIEYGLSVNATAIVTATDIRMERVLRRSGWPLQRVGDARKLEQTTAVAGLLEVSKGARAAIYENGDIAGPVLTNPSAFQAVA